MKGKKTKTATARLYDFDSDIMGATVPMSVVLPPNYDRDGDDWHLDGRIWVSEDCVQASAPLQGDCSDGTRYRAFSTATADLVQQAKLQTLQAIYLLNSLNL